MKKLLSVVLVLCLMLSMLVACGSGSEDTGAEGKDSKPTASETVSEKEEADDEEESSSEEKEESSEEESSSEEEEDEDDSSSSKKSSSKKSSSKKSSSKKSSSKKSSSKKSSSNKSSSGKEDDKPSAEVKNISDFKGTWKLGNGTVFCYTINDKDNTVIAYAENGFTLGTFPVVATAEGVVLKMGELGNVTLKDPSTLTITAVPAVTDYSAIVGTYEMIYGEHVGAVLNMKESTWDITSDKYNDVGSYTIMDGEAVLSPTKELGGNVYHKILGGGKILEAYQPSSRIYVEKSFGATKVGKALRNYYDLIMNDWTCSDYDVEFTDKGRVLIAGEEMGIWYPTTTGATAELSDGSTQYVEFTDNGINFYYKELTRKQ